MKKIYWLMTGVMAVITSFTAEAAVDFSTVTKYAAACESELGFDASQVPALINCNDGLAFNAANDKVGRAQVNLYVDLVFACRRVSANGAFATSIELLIHNRSSGSTCFFAAKDPLNNPPGGPDPLISTGLLPPTSPYADLTWMTNPNHLGTCVGCHVAGPYIASPSIAPALAQFGLINDGHDTSATRYHSVGSVPATQPSGIPTVQNPFVDWDSIVFRNNVTAENTCANGCHSIGINSKAKAIVSADGTTLIPSLQDDRIDIDNSGVMPANNPTNTNIDNSYNWVNMNSPLGTRGDFETLSGLQHFYQNLSCANPVSVEAHVVGSDERIRTDEIPDKLNRFNLQDGLVCLNTDQPNGKKCHDYQTRYMCNGRFTSFQNLDDPSYSGDWEPRNSFKGLCANPTWMQARYQWNGVWVYVNAPADRLAEFDNNGLVCHNADQNNGQCSNYVVRFNCQ